MTREKSLPDEHREECREAGGNTPGRELQKALAQERAAYRRLRPPSVMEQRIRAAYSARAGRAARAAEGARDRRPVWPAGVLAGAALLVVVGLLVTGQQGSDDLYHSSTAVDAVHIAEVADSNATSPASLSLARLDISSTSELGALSTLNRPTVLALLSPSRIPMPSLQQITPDSRSPHSSHDPQEEKPQS